MSLVQQNQPTALPKLKSTNFNNNNNTNMTNKIPIVKHLIKDEDLGPKEVSDNAIFFNLWLLFSIFNFVLGSQTGPARHRQSN